MTKKPTPLSPVILRECDTPGAPQGSSQPHCFLILILDIMIFVRTTLKIIAGTAAGHCCAERGRNCTDTGMQQAGQVLCTS